MKSIAFPDRTWELVTLDLITALPETKNGYDACVVFVDRLSKMVHYAPCTKSIDARKMAALFIREVVWIHDLRKPLIVGTDACQTDV